MSSEQLKPRTEAGHFFSTDIRVGRILEVQEFPEARKPAYRFTADFGPAAGVLRTSAQVTNYPMDELKGRLIIGVINLGAKRIAGFTSEFLVLGSYGSDGTVNLLSPEPHAAVGDIVG
ncbi:tRNA-binding protein [Streptomyces sp. ACA25]|uniref:tRNA-binding protein n=1 Tax=Streptomyces sp. ACA25 TaxID=3022596 RepID=UPI0023075BD1|nr:tRNA-binding protein [Streptomyces sp. ACA25]MDB1086444.1 tRNA-binding protein [Streptomyces sp. ACA25]